MATTMVPERAVLPDVLPTERLTASGRPVPEVRAELRRIDGGRNALTVAGAWAYAAGIVAAAVALSHPLAWAAAFVLMGSAFARLFILSHEAAHRLLFRRKAVNDWVGRWLLGYPALFSLDAYRRVHMAHHKDELGPEEPDLGLYAGYPITWASLRRKLTRDALFVSGWKISKPILRALTSASGRPTALRILAAQVAVLAAFTAVGRPELYPFLWLGPWLTVWRVINRLRAIAEHGGMTRSGDRRLTTHHVRQSFLARFWMVPYNTGWHLAHHVDIAIPWRNLPRLHEELTASGWVTPAITYPNYRSLWKALASG